MELRLPIILPAFKDYGGKVLDGLESLAREKGWRVADDSREGVRISLGAGEGSGWLLLRLSVHNPVMPLNIESDVPGGCRIIARGLLPYLREQEGLDRTAVEKFCEENGG